MEAFYAPSFDASHWAGHTLWRDQAELEKLQELVMAVEEQGPSPKALSGFMVWSARRWFYSKQEPEASRWLGCSSLNPEWAQLRSLHPLGTGCWKNKGGSRKIFGKWWGGQHMVITKKIEVQMLHPAWAEAALLLWPRITFSPSRASHKVLGSEWTSALTNVQPLSLGVYLAASPNDVS